MVADTQEPSGEHNRKDFGRATWAFLVLFLVACALWRLSYLPLISVAGLPAAGVGRILGTWIDVAIALGLVAGFLAPRWWLRTLLALVFADVCVARLSD